RVQEAREVRFEAARYQASRPVPTHLANGDEQLYPDHMANFTKALPHDDKGHVVAGAYEALLKAMETGAPEDFEAIPLGGTRKLVNPQSAFAYDLMGADSHHLTMPPAPSFASAEAAGEMVELYWHALTRDVPFDAYATDPLIQQAAASLSSLSDFRGPKDGGRVTAANIFRGTTPGELNGPYISQFLLKDVPYGSRVIRQQNRVPIAGNDYVTKYDEWLAIQNGAAPASARNTYDAQRRYIRNARDLGEFIHIDVSFQAYLNALLILLGTRSAFDKANPYLTTTKTQGNVTFNDAYIGPLVCSVGNRAQKAVYFQKWSVHRRLRPEEFGGRLHNLRTGAASYPIHSDVKDNEVLNAVFSKFGTYLLPQAYPEGSPIHPSYGAGHSVIAGACCTVLKAFFDEDAVVADPVVASPDGLSLVPYSGPPLTVGGELNKLASNCSIGRNIAGVHYRTEAIESMLLGEAVAIEILKDEKFTYHEQFEGFSLTKFDGTKITI
ncbi:MAG TPA: vanadium-dependent haloperoxidase, partial [Myxococcaceae bacterium]|nr:vanadium-dependent haloperoxidase [Myxococcaceae bacterium]